MVNGRELLTRLDANICDMRGRLVGAVQASEEASADEVELRQEQLNLYSDLAEIRLDFIQSTEAVPRFNHVHREAKRLMEQHKAQIAAEKNKIDQISTDLLRLEAERGEWAKKHEAATDAYDARVRKIEAELTTDPGYTELLKVYKASSSIVTRAEQKQQLALDDRKSKGAPYDNDPLFSYLWKRQFKTPNYRATPWIRALDNWVADLCKYEEAYLNYQRLIALPVRLAEHVAMVTRESDDCLDALEAFEDEALKVGGAEELRKASEEIAASIAVLDKRIDVIEADRHALMSAYDLALLGETRLVIKARDLIEDALEQASMPSLRVMAAETIGTDDDRIVDALLQLRRDEAVVEREAKAANRNVEGLRADVRQIEICRKRLKSANLVSPYVVYVDARVDEVLSRLNNGAVSGTEAFGIFKRLAKRSGAHSSGFGGRRRTQTMGVPGVLGDVMWEVAKEVIRQSARGNSRGGYNASRRRGNSSTIRVPRSSGSRHRGGGGFKTGGGF